MPLRQTATMPAKHWRQYRQPVALSIQRRKCLMSRAVLLPVLIAIVTAAPALAQSQTPQPGLGGNPVPGVCLLSREAIFSNAKIGVAASARLKQITDQAQAEIDADRKPVEAEVQAFQNDAATLTPEQRQTRERALSAKLVPIQTKAQQRSREV